MELTIYYAGVPERVRVAPAATAQDAIVAAAFAFSLTRTGSAERARQYHLTRADSGLPLDEARLLADQGISSGARLVLEPKYWH
jgi:hypothetical protein